MANEKKTTTKTETTSEVKTTTKKENLTNRQYSTLLDAAKTNKIKIETLQEKAVAELKAVISSAYESIKKLNESKTPVSDFIHLTRAEQSNKVLQISSGSLEQRLGYDRETYTSVEPPKTKEDAILYTLLACIGWDATARLCGIVETNAPKKAKSPKASAVSLNF